jgi:hypothetical protein
MERFLKLMEVYSLEEILENMELEPAEALELLGQFGYECTLEEPL